MLTRRGAATTALAIIAAGLGANAPAFATASATTLYVNNAQAANCSDSGTGTQAQPYCTIQTAVNAASAGQTVLIEPGTYKESVTITHSGTPSQPITIKGDSALAPVFIANSTSAATVTISGASDVVVTGLEPGDSPGGSVLIDGSHDVTFGNSSLNFVFASYGNGQIHVTGGSTNIDLVKIMAVATTRTPIVIDGGGSGDVVSTSLLELSEGAGISVDSATGVDIVSNTIDGSCGSGIALTGSATGATIENNVVYRVAPPSGTSLTCPAPKTPPRGILVGSGAASGAVENYNDVDTGSAAATDYQWSGTDYGTAAALEAATGQAATDSNAPTLTTGLWDMPLEKSPAVDSANASAPGEQSTDVEGYARADDPLVANTGSGASAYYDRGAMELQDQLSFTEYTQITSGSGAQVTQAPVGAQLTYSTTVASTWGGSLNYTYDFGDGTTATSATGTATHTFTATGQYQQDVKVTSSLGGHAECSCNNLTIDTGVPTPVLKVTRAGDMSVSLDLSASTDPWGVYGATVDFGDATSASAYDLTKPVTHTYATAGTFTITLTLEDDGATNAQTTAAYTTDGSDFTAYGPTRVLDTRKGTGTGGVVAPVGPGASIQVPIGGTGTIPADATAVALNVTETGATGGGYITAYPAGGALPATSNLNYVKGQTKAANVVVGLGTGGEVTLTNASNGSVNLIADVTGYFTKSYAAGYQPIAPTRILDTRKGTGLPGGTAAKVAAGQTIAVGVNGSGAGAVVLNLTATDTASGGYITAYPDGGTAPLASSLNFAPGNTIANTVIVPVGSDGKVDFFNGSGGTVSLVADEEGYFTQGAGDAFVPIAPTRLYDSRKSTALAGGGTVTLTPSAIDAQVPGEAAAYLYNVTVTQPAAGGYLTVFPAGQARPTASNVNFAAGETTSNTALAAAGADAATGAGANSFYNGTGGSLQLVTDLFGYFAAQ